MSKTPDSIVIRFKPSIQSPPQYQTVFETENGFALVVEKTGSMSVDGALKFLLTGSSGILSCSTAVVPLFNSSFWDVVVQRSVSTSSINVDQIYTVKATSAGFDKLNFYTSSSLQISGSLTSSYNASFVRTGSLYIGGALPTSSFISSVPFVGNISSFKLYTEVLDDVVFRKQSFAENSVVSNNVSSSFENLVTYLRFEDNVDLSISSSVYDSNLSTHGKNHGTASGFDRNRYVSRYQKDVVKLTAVGLNKPVSNKIRIDSVSTASLYIFPDSSSLNKYGANSNKVDFIFSPTNIENKNIVRFLNLDINDYIGDPSILFDDSGVYSDLNNLYKYYRKYYPAVDLQDYVNRTYKLSKQFFKNVGGFVPARTNFNGGISIEPTLLERTNVIVNKSVNVSNLYYDNRIPISLICTISSSVHNLSSSIVAVGNSTGSEYLSYTAIVPDIQVYATSTVNDYLGALGLQNDISSSSDYLFKGTGNLLSRDDRILLQGIKKAISITNTYTTYSELDEITTQSYVEPISNVKYELTYDSASSAYYYSRNSAMQALYDSNYDTYYSPMHVRYYVYDSIGQRRSKFHGTLNTGPEHPSGASTIDSGRVIETTYISPNKITVVTHDSDKPRLKVDGVDLDV